jgi:hypothetical protein
MDRDLLDLMEKRKMPVYVIDEDLSERGIDPNGLVPGIRRLSRSRLPALFAEHAIVSHW